MASFGGFFAAAAGPIAKKVLIALGLGVVSYAGVDAAFGVARDAIIANWGGLSADIANLASLGGIGTGIGIILGGISARIALLAISHIGAVTA
jgi:hypothetical protein